MEKLLLHSYSVFFSAERACILNFGRALGILLQTITFWECSDYFIGRCHILLIVPPPAYLYASEKNVFPNIISPKYKSFFFFSAKSPK